MNEKNLDEIKYRRQAFKFFDKGKSPTRILQLIPRSRAWLFKWKRRFQQEGARALDSLSKTAKSLPHAYDPSVQQTVLRVRTRREKQKVGLIGARAVWLELRRGRLVEDVPSMSTIKRWLRAAGCGRSGKQVIAAAYYPALRFNPGILFAACDWIARYIKGGEKVFVFHSVDAQTRAVSQSIAQEKTAEVACAHLVQSLQELGLIDFLQLDNDAAFTGLGRKSRIFGRFVRLALYFGVELIFLPPREPKRNSLVERVNGLWATHFWDKDHFRSVTELKRKNRKFLAWYVDYAPPALHGLSVKEAGKKARRRRKLGQRALAHVPSVLPLTEGRIHFIRRVNETGSIEILKESFRVSKQIRGAYVWATIDLKKQSLRIYYRRSARSQAKLLKAYAYQIEERVVKLLPANRRNRTRVDILQII